MRALFRGDRNVRLIYSLRRGVLRSYNLHRDGIFREEIIEIQLFAGADSLSLFFTFELLLCHISRYLKEQTFRFSPYFVWI